MIKAINDPGRHFEPLRSKFEATVIKVLRSGWYGLGPEVTAFEKTILCRDAGVALTEDCAQAHGAEMTDDKVKLVVHYVNCW